MHRQLFSALLLVISILPANMHAQDSRASQGTAKVACTPCEEYFGMGNYPTAPVAAIPSSISGLFYFVNLPHPDTNLQLIRAEWIVLPDHWTNYTTQPGDTFMHQFLFNGPDTVIVNALYRVSSWMGVIECYGYGQAIVNVVGVPQTPTVTDAMQDVEDDRLIAYPNPSNGVVHLEWSSKNAQDYTVRLFSSSGQEIGEATQFKNGKLDLNLQSVVSGNYHLVLTSMKNSRILTLVRE